MIPAQAVDAAAKALRKKFNGYDVDRPWDSRDQRTTYHNDAIASLEAAAPHMLAEAWDEAIARATEVAWEHDASASSAVSQIPNPYRSAK